MWLLTFYKFGIHPIENQILSLCCYFSILRELPENRPLWQFTESLFMSLFNLLRIIELANVIC